MTPITITIQRPQLAKRLAEDAKRQGLDVEDYAQHLLENTLEAQAAKPTEGKQTDPSNEEGATTLQTPTSLNQWLGEFDAWVASHPKREPLPEAAFERESFYPQEWREQAA